MEAIFLVNGVYVCIDYNRSYKREVEEEQTFIVDEGGRCVLFGGRVVVKGSSLGYWLSIDGIELSNLTIGDTVILSKRFSIEAITAIVR